MTQPDSPSRGVVRIPADIEVPDKVLGPLTARQLIVLAVPAGALYGVWQATSDVVPVAVFLAVAAPLLATVATLVGVHRDGLTLDRLLLAAVRHHRQGTRLVTGTHPTASTPRWMAATASEQPRRPRGRRPRRWTPPARAVTTAETPAATAVETAAATAAAAGRGFGGLGIIDLGADGSAVVAAAAGVNLGLRTPAEQEAVVAGFGRYLHSLTAPVQILVRAERIDLTDTITELAAAADHLPDPGLAGLARDHAGFLADLAERSLLLRREILLIWRDPTPTALQSRRQRRRHRGGGRGGGWPGAGSAARRAVHDRLARRVGEAVDLLAPIGITILGLDPARARMVLAAAINPARPRPPTGQDADPHEVITVTGPTAGPPAESQTGWTGWVW